jgi:hypothetical protein
VENPDTAGHGIIRNGLRFAGILQIRTQPDMWKLLVDKGEPIATMLVRLCHGETQMLTDSHIRTTERIMDLVVEGMVVSGAELKRSPPELEAMKKLLVEAVLIAKDAELDEPTDVI